MEQFGALHRKKKKKSHIYNLYYAVFSTLMGPVNVFILLRNNSPDSERHLGHYAQCHVLYKTVIHFHDSSSSPWTERRGRFYICPVVINSTFSCGSCSHNHNSKLKAPIHGTFVLHRCPPDYTFWFVFWTHKHIPAPINFYIVYRIIHGSMDIYI